ncbi:MAG: DUF1540 domain-containing protein [Clostridia bacterium]|nr:DUF1540 domain-containing protein [Clostridia bacterium]
MNEGCKCNSGVRCNVECCLYNEAGTKCTKDCIVVTKGDTETMHWCGSFQQV